MDNEAKFIKKCEKEVARLDAKYKKMYGAGFTKAERDMTFAILYSSTCPKKVVK